jgi:UDPglucose 6-dehydrogenase/GDP-mannose 6-dehydrogenase
MSEYLSSNADGKRHKAKITSFLNPGCGFGGSCLPKDVKALVAQGQGYGLPMGLLEQVIQVNQGQPQRLLDILKHRMQDLQGRTIGVLGLAFKEGTDDMRESPAIPVIDGLLSAGADVITFDPIAMPMAHKVLPDDVKYAEGLQELVLEADALLLTTRCSEFLELPDLLKELGREDLLVVDGRRFIDKNSVANYDGIGL